VKELVKVKDAESESERACDFTDAVTQLLQTPRAYNWLDEEAVDDPAILIRIDSRMAAVKYVEGFSRFPGQSYDRNQCGCQQSDFRCKRLTLRASELGTSGYLYYSRFHARACISNVAGHRWQYLYKCVCISKVPLQHGY
jgi:hypothetical protein